MNIQTDAQITADRINTILSQRGLSAPVQWKLVNRDGRHWLFAVMDARAMSRMSSYTSEDVIHHLSTALQGRPVVISNTTGLRYGVLLSGKPELPASVELQSDPNGRFPFGVGIKGPIYSKVGNNVGEWLHILVAGTTGSGKSNFLQVIAWTALVSSWRLFLGDPDGATFNPESPMWSCCLVAQSPVDVEKMLIGVEDEINHRSELYQRQPGDLGMTPQDLDEYNHYAAEKLPRILVCIDEANTYFGDKDLVARLSEIARRGRKWGISLVMAAHSWRANDVPRMLSGMFNVRVCFRVNDDTTGRVVLGNNPRLGRRAMNLNHPGRAILMMNGKRPEIIQAYRMPDVKPQPVEARPVFEDWQIELVEIARDDLNGEFIIDKLAPYVEGRITRYRIAELAKQWERRGYLSKPAHATAARQVLPRLLQAAGIE